MIFHFFPIMPSPYQYLSDKFHRLKTVSRFLGSGLDSGLGLKIKYDEDFDSELVSHRNNFFEISYVHPKWIIKITR